MKKADLLARIEQLERRVAQLEATNAKPPLKGPYWGPSIWCDAGGIVDRQTPINVGGYEDTEILRRDVDAAQMVQDAIADITI